jgi:LytR cell envelope-related transcriptional attenuator
MVAIPFGLSVHHFVSTIGADVGFASLIGLALLVLLFFSQARETSTLRTRADEASLRIQELEGEVADLADQLAALPAEISVRAASPRAAAAYGGFGAAATVAAVGGAGAHLPPAAPAGVGGPALAAATRLIPDPDPMPAYEPATAQGHANGAGRSVLAASSATIERPVPARAGDAPRPVAAPPRVAAGGGAGTRGGGPNQPRPVGAGQGRSGGAQGRGGQRVGAPQYAGPSRPSGAPLRPPPRRSRGRLVLGALVAVLALVAVAAGVIALAGGKSASSASRSSASASLASHRTRALTSAVQPSTVTVSVLNGTDQAGLAGDVARRLVGAGYRKGDVANASDQTHTTSLVAYMLPSFRRDALAVAASLKLPTSSVALVDPTTKAIACPSSQACTSAVVVTVGKDLATP